MLLDRRPHPCPCGGLMVPATRIGPHVDQVTGVLTCWTCGEEEPSLYGRTRSERHGCRFRPTRRKPGQRRAPPIPGDWMSGRLVIKLGADLP